MDRRALHLPTWTIGAVALATGACGASGEQQRTTSPAPPATATPPALTPMTEAEIRRDATGCLQHPPYPIDGGPQCLRADGAWILYSGWGNSTGRYRIDGNRVILWTEPGVMGPQPSSTIAFFRRRDGTMVLRYDDPGGDLRLWPYRPYPETDYLSHEALLPSPR